MWSKIWLASFAKTWTDPVNELFHDSREGGYQGDVIDGWELLEELGFEVNDPDLMDNIRSSFSGHGWCHVDYYGLSDFERIKLSWQVFSSVVKQDVPFIVEIGQCLP